MTELILRINNPLELEQLLPILQQLKIRYQSRSIKQPKRVVKKEAILAKIQAGNCAVNLPASSAQTIAGKRYVAIFVGA